MEPPYPTSNTPVSPSTLFVKLLTPTAKSPTRTHPGDAGLDLFANERVIIYAHTAMLIKTGIAVAIPPNHVGLIKDRSSMGLKNIHVYGGVIDSSYRGEVCVVLHTSDRAFVVNEGEKIAQLLVIPVVLPQVKEVFFLAETERGNKGFGSSGV